MTAATSTPGAADQGIPTAVPSLSGLSPERFSLTSQAPTPPRTDALLASIPARIDLVPSPRRPPSRIPSWLYFFSFATPLDLLLYLTGLLSAMAAGLAFPGLDLLYGSYINHTTGDATSSVRLHESRYVALVVMAIGWSELILTWVFLSCFTLASTRLSARLREAYLSSVLYQDAHYFDTHGAGEVVTRLSKDVNAVRGAWGEKMAFLIWSSSTLVAGMVVAFVRGTRLAGVLFSLLPFTLLLFLLSGIPDSRVAERALELEGRASTFLEQVLSSVRVVHALGAENKLRSRWDQTYLKPLQRDGFLKALVRGVELGSIYFVLNLAYAVAYWYGSVRVAAGDLTVGQMGTTFFSVLNSLFCMANVVPLVPGISEGFAAQHHLKKEIERVPTIDVRDSTGLMRSGLDGTLMLRGGSGEMAVGGDLKGTFRPADPLGPSPSGASVVQRQSQGKEGGGGEAALWKPEIEVRHLTFSYPGRSNVKSLDDVSMTIEAGKVTALVGVSGSGKSTIAGLLLRQYDPPAPSTTDSDENCILLSGRDLREYNLQWLRSQIAVCSQDPQIFTATVFENVAAGLTGTEWEYRPGQDDDDGRSERVSQIRALVQRALVQAQAWDFVCRLPNGMDTQVTGAKTGVLSGGQRQRLAVARALIRRPDILVLDEATSALDSATEKRLQEALEEEQRQRAMTTIIIAHRLSTIAHAHKIYVMNQGHVIEEGTWKTLSDEKGAFWGLLSKQQSLQDDSQDRRADEAKRKEAEIYASRGSETSDGQRDGEEREEEEDRFPTPPHTASMRTTGQAQPAQTHSHHGFGPLHRASSTITTFTSSMPPTPAHPLARDVASMADFELPEHDPCATPSGHEPHQAGDLEKVAEAPASLVTLHDQGPKELSGARVLRGFLRYFGQQAPYIFTGALAAVIVGVSFPIAGWLTGVVVEAFTEQVARGNISGLRHDGNRYALACFIIALADLVFCFTNGFMFEYGSERMVRQLKKTSLDSVLMQEVGFFDKEENAAGTLTASISGNPPLVAAATGLIVGQIIISVVNLVGATILAFILSWKGAVVCLAPVVVLLFSGWLNVVLLEKFEGAISGPLDAAEAIVAENVDAIKTVAALGREEEVLRLYRRLAKPAPRRDVYLALGAFGFAISQASVFLISSLTFYWGGTLLGRGELTVKELYALFEAIIIGAFAASRIFTFVPDISRAVHAFKTIMGWVERQPQMAQCVTPEPGKEMQKAEKDVCDSFLFDHVTLRYPERPREAAVRDLNLFIPAGKKVAFCGTSGSGKTSILSLLCRFYDPSLGRILQNDRDVRAIPIQDYRTPMALVSQDSVLYEGTIRFNILLGVPEGAAGEVGEEDVERACRDANVWDFVCSLPNGLDTEVGLKGSQLSGGQRQRICIARAIIRKPRILLLDEATSALDADSEEVVQRALDRVSHGRTTVTIAHRLASIRNSDIIHVVEEGRIVESGSHQELLSKRGRYLELVEAQL